MKKHILPLIAVAFVLSIGFPRWVLADDDYRMIGKFDHTGPHDALSVASLYLTFEDNKAHGLPAVPSGDATRIYTKVWDGLYLQITTENGDIGTSGYLFDLSKDEDGKSLLSPKEDPDQPTLREVTAGDFRTDDNSSTRPLHPGPGTPQDRGVLHIVHYPGLDMEIRVLEFNIGDAELGKKPYFQSLSCLVTVREVAKAKAH